jgi:hypothetical protein
LIARFRGLKKLNISITQIVCIRIASDIVLYKPILSKIFETIKPPDINPKEKQAAIMPIVPSV